MPVGAIIGSTVVGVGASVAGASAQKKAANTAATTAANNNNANNALATQMYGNNAARLDPFAAQGFRAGSTLSELLLGPSAAPAQPAPMPMPASNDFGGLPFRGVGRMDGRDMSFSGMGPSGEPMSPALSALGGSQGNMQHGQPVPVPGAVGAPAPGKSAWDTFRDSTNYQFRLDEGNRGINQGYAAAGQLQSGAAAKALLKYNQDYAGNELGNYMNMLAGQQNMGLNAARAVAGVGGDMVTNVTANNNAGAGAAANAALLNGTAKAGMYGDIASGIGRGIGAIGALGGSSYGSSPYFGMHPASRSSAPW